MTGALVVAAPKHAPAVVADGSRWSTPRLLRAALVGAWILSLVLFVVSEAALARARAAVRTLHKDAAPSIVLALEMRALLADLDANAANLVLESSVHGDAAMVKLEEVRVKVSTRLVEAAQNITYGDAEKKPIVAITTALGRYLELFGEARFRHLHGNDPEGAVASLRAASELMHTEILPAAEALDEANKNVMNDVYAAQVRTTGGAEGASVALAALLGLTLVATQIYLFKRTKRVFNPALILATIVVFGFGRHMARSFEETRVDLKIAKEDAFESIHLLWRVRAVAYDANGDESRYLVDAAHEGEHEAAFRRRVAWLTSTPRVSPALEATLSTLADGTKAPFSGLFADELSNVTFAGERRAAIAMMKAFDAYYVVDGQIRAAHERRTDAGHAAAIALCLGRSNTLFDLFDQATSEVIEINRAQFDRALEAADASLRTDGTLAPFCALFVALAAFAGLRARLAEYA